MGQRNKKSIKYTGISKTDSRQPQNTDFTLIKRLVWIPVSDIIILNGEEKKKKAKIRKNISKFFSTILHNKTTEESAQLIF